MKVIALVIALLSNVALSTSYDECEWNTAFMNWTAQTVCNCTGSDSGGVECYSDYKNQSSELIVAACSWRHLELCDPTEWQWNEYGWFDCPSCSCNTTNVTWVTESDDWGSNCYGCICTDSNYQCDWISSWGSEDNETCPSSTGSYCLHQTEWNTQLFESDTIGVHCDQEWGWNATTSTSYQIAETCQAMYCVDNGTLTNITLTDIVDNEQYQVAVMDNDQFRWMLMACWTNVSEWYITSNNFWCTCSMSENETVFETVPMSYLQEMGGIEELYEVCLVKSCETNEWTGAEAMMADFVGMGLSPITCPPTLSCPAYDDEEEEEDSEYCVSSNQCYASQSTEFPDQWYSGAFEATNNSGCAEGDIQIQCLSVTNATVPCATATYTANIFRFDCDTQAATSYALTQTDTLTCAANGDDLDLSSCLASDVYARAELWKWEVLFGNQAMVETFGALECEYASEDSGFFDEIFFREQCNSEHVKTYSQHIAEAYCGYMMIFGETMDTTGKEFAEKSFEGLMGQIAAQMANGGCNFTVNCDVTGGTGYSVHISTEVVEMEVELPAANTQKSGWEQKVQNKLAEQLGVKNSSVTVVGSSESNSVRRLSDDTNSVTVSVNCVNRESATQVEAAIDNDAVTIGNVRSVRTVEVNEEMSTPTAAPTQAPTTTTTTNSNNDSASGAFIHVAIICSLVAAIFG